MSQCRQCQRPLKNCICRGKPSDGAGFGSFLTGAIVGAAVVGVGALFAMAASEENSKQTQKPRISGPRPDVRAGIRNVVCEKTDDDTHACQICMENKVNCVFRPCNHARICTDCALEVTHCPECRTEITEMIRIYI